MPQLKPPRMQAPAGAERQNTGMVRVPIQGAPSIPEDRIDLIKMLVELGIGGMGRGMRGGMPNIPTPSNIPNQRVFNPTSIEQPGMSGMSPLDTLKWLESRPAWAKAKAMGEY